MRIINVAIISAAVLGITSARVGLGPCPTTYPQVNDAWAAGSDLTDGRYYVVYADKLGYDIAKTYLWNDVIDCFGADVNKISTGFHWFPLTKVPSLSSCRRDVKCDAGDNTCNCYVTAKPWEVIWVDAASQSFAAYGCASMLDAAKTGLNNLNNPPVLAALVDWAAPALTQLHYSGIAVASKDPNFNTNSAAKGRLNTFISSFPDQVPGYVSNWFAYFVAWSAGKYNGNPNYSLTDFQVMEQRS